VLGLAGCGGSKSGTPAPQPDSKAKAPEAAPAQAQAPVAKPPTITVKVGSTEKAALKNLPLFLNGVAEQEGIKVEYVEFKGGAEVSKALLNGDVDLALTTVDTVFKDKSGEFRLLSMVTNGPGQALIVDNQAKDSIKSVKDLVGKTVGVSSIGSGPHKTLLDLLAANGIDSKSVQVVPVGLDAREVLGTGRVQAMVTIEPYISLVEKAGTGVILVDARKPDGIKAIYKTVEVPWIALISTTGYIKDHGDAVQRLVNTVSKSLQFIAANPGAKISAQAPSFFKDEVKGDETLFTKMLEDNKATFSANGQFNPDSMGILWKRLQDGGSVPKDKQFDMPGFVDAKYLQNVK
jgi:NitT/TauT family transport system substrate-binding protein